MPSTLEPTFTANSLAYLHSINETPILTNNGRWRFRKQALRSSLGAPDDFDMIEMPTHIDSFDALVFAGLKKRTARSIYQWYMTLKADPDLSDHVCLIEVVKTNLDYSNYTIDCDRRHDRHTWERTLYDLGIRRELRELMLGPAFDVVRRSKSAKKWAALLVTMVMKDVDGADMLVRSKQGLP